MSDNQVSGFGKDPVAPSHGESLVDQSFQSLKSKEVRDSLSPTEMRFQSMALNNPNTTGWNVQSSTEMSPDGRGFRAETVATTDGVENVNGGIAEFKGRNEQRSSAMHQGDDKNFVKKASESSNTHLQEKVVMGDENSGRTEVRTSSTKSTSSSQVIQSSSTTDFEHGQPMRYITDSHTLPSHHTEPQHQESRPYFEPHDATHSLDHQRSTNTHYDQQSEQYIKNSQQTTKSQNVQTNETHEQNKRYVDMDKASPEYQQHVQYLMSQPGEIISNTVEYPKPNVKMITTVKRLPDGTIVRNKRYETEETSPIPPAAATRSTTSNQTNQRRDSQTSQQSKNYRAPSEPNRRPSNDVVDNAEVKHYTHNVHNDNVSNVETKYSTTKTSNRKFSTETSSEVVQEYDDHPESKVPGQRLKHITNDFSTHGFPSVRPNKPTQEFVTDRPAAPSYEHQPTHNIPRRTVVPQTIAPNEAITERRIPTDDGEVIIVSSEKRRNVKHQTNSERIIETDVRTTDDNRYQQVTDATHKTTEDLSTYASPTVRYPDSPSGPYDGRRPMHPVNSGQVPYQAPLAPYEPTAADDMVFVNSQRSHTSKQTTNSERIIETELVDEQGRPTGRITTTGVERYSQTPAGTQHPTGPAYDQGPQRYSQTPAEGRPHATPAPGSNYSPQAPGKTSAQGSPTSRGPDFSTHGFPSAKSPTKTTSGHSYPQEANRPPNNAGRRPPSPVKSRSPSKKSNTTVETTERIIQKEKEVDAAHRAFAASLRSSSPVDNTRRDSFSTDGPRHTPRSSVSSTRTFRRDMREGSHDSAAGSETSRVSTTTVTRQTPPKSVGGRTVVTKQTVVTTKNDEASPSLTRGTKSPSPSKSVTTTTTTRTVTSKAAPRDVPRPDASPRPSPAPSSRSSPYPSKSKSPSGDDNQSTKLHPSRPLSPPSSTRSPHPIGYKDVPNSRGQSPRSPDRGEPMPMEDREVVEETTSVTRRRQSGQVTLDDHAEEHVDSRLLIGRKPSNPQSNRPRPEGSPLVLVPSSDPKSVPKTSITTERRTTRVQKVVPATISPGITKQTPRKPAEILTPVDQRNRKPVHTPTHDISETTQIDITTRNKKSRTQDQLGDRPLSPVKKQAPNTTRSSPMKQPKTIPSMQPNGEEYPTNDTSTHKIHDATEVHVQRKTQRTHDKFGDTPPKQESLSERRPKQTAHTTLKKTQEPNITVIGETEDVVHEKNKISRIRETFETHSKDRPSQKPVPKSVPIKPSSVNTSDKQTQEWTQETSEISTGKQIKKGHIPTVPCENIPSSREESPEKLHPTDEPTANTRKSTPKPTHEHINHKSTKANDLRETTEIYIETDDRTSNAPDTIYSDKPSSRLVSPTIPRRVSPEVPGKEQKPIDSDEELEHDRALETSTLTDRSRGDKIDLHTKKTPIQERNVPMIPCNKEPKSARPQDASPEGRDKLPKRPSERTATSESEDEPRTEHTSVTKTNSKNSELYEDLTESEFEYTPGKKIVAPIEDECRPKGTEDALISILTTSTDREKDNKRTTMVHQQFMDAERSTRTENPDGAFVSKTAETPSSPSSPTYKKKGTTRRDTFEDRCREILGMESYGDTPGTFKKRPQSDAEPVNEETRQRDSKQTSIFKVKIEDCGEDDDDEPFSITSVKKTLIQKKDEPVRTKDSVNEHYDKETDYTKSGNEPIYQATISDTTQTDIYGKRPHSRSPSPKKNSPMATEIRAPTSVKRTPSRSPSPQKESPTVSDVKLPTSEDRTPSRPSSPKKDSPIVSDVQQPTSRTRTPSRSPSPKKNHPSGGDVKSPASGIRMPSRSPSPNKEPAIRSDKSPTSGRRTAARSPSPKKEASATFTSTNVTTTQLNSNTQQTSAPRSPLKPQSPTKVTRATAPAEKKSPTRPELVTDTTTIKDRLRSSTRNMKNRNKPDQTDGDSSPDVSPSRCTERRRSSNISVNTEIIIEHTDVETKPKKHVGRQQTESVYREIIDSTTLPDKLPKKMQVTERKESAPVHRVTRKDKDSKMSRSTSENLIEVTKSQAVSNVEPKAPTKSPDTRRPNKCFSTKTINLSTTDRLLTSEDMENVVIDIQQAKSSREPSPDKIVPTPVPAHFDTGKPRYPDVVQEPEDEPRRKPLVKNIPIFEEEHNDYVGCHITEVSIDKSRKTVDYADFHDDEVATAPLVEAPASLDYVPPRDEVFDDECLLSVHDKVSKFQHIAEEVTRPKPSSPFNRQFDESTPVPEDDECLLTVDEKVDKFIRTAESLAKEPTHPESGPRRARVDLSDQDLDTTECTYTTVKLPPSAPQKSPEMVRHISRTISRQSDAPHDGEEAPTEPYRQYQHTHETRGEYESKRSTQTSVTHHLRQKAAGTQRPITSDKDSDASDGEELIPHTASHTTRLEERRQKNILGRPSVFENGRGPKAPAKQTKPKHASPVKDSEKTKTTTAAKPLVKPHAQSETPRAAPVRAPESQPPSAAVRKQRPSQRPEQSPAEYDYRRSGRQTGVVNIHTTTVHTEPHSINGAKKSPQPAHKKPGRQSPTRPTSVKNVKHERLVSGDIDIDDGVAGVGVGDDDAEFDVALNDREAEVIIDSETTIRSTVTNRRGTGKVNVRTEPAPNTHTSQAPRKMKEIPISRSSPSPTKSTKAHLVDVAERSTKTQSTTNVITKANSTGVKSVREKNDLISECPAGRKPPQAPSSKSRPGSTVTDSVAARRSLFEKHINGSTSPSPSPGSPGRRPSYMDHTKSSLEHIRRDSLELNKTHYSRKPSTGCDDDEPQTERNTQVKFEVPHKVQRNISVEFEGVAIEEIFDLEVLEKMLETVTSYELRRRIRAQIRLVKKNLSNLGHQKREPETTNATKTREPSPQRGSANVEESTSRVTKKHYYYREEERTSSSTHTSPERVQRSVTTKVTRTHSPEQKKPVAAPYRSASPQQKSSPVRVSSKDSPRSPSPEKEHTYMEVERKEKIEHREEYQRSSSPKNRSPSRRSPIPQPAHDRSDVDNAKVSRKKHPSEVPTSRSPDRNDKVSSSTKTSASYVSTTKKVANVNRPTPDAKSAPVWADRKNVLKSPTATPKRPASTTNGSSPASIHSTKTSTSRSQKLATKKSHFVEEDCVTSSYGIGPTDENGLPLFGIRALKKKKPPAEPCETKEEVSGYVVEERYYSDGRSKPLVERKEIVYSSDPKELDAVKRQAKKTSIAGEEQFDSVSTTIRSDRKAVPTLTNPEESVFEASSQKHVRRGSVKEMSEKFIHKESAASVMSEKVSSYPKAGLILRTNSRKQSRENDSNDDDPVGTYVTPDSGEDVENMTRENIRGRSPLIGAESESDSESVHTKHAYKKVTSSTRTFLNSKGEDRIVTKVTDVLDRMRNADEVVEDGDTAEDQEARALLNKFLGASIIMKGVESAMPMTRETKVTSSTATGGERQPAKHEVKTTRITKSFKAGSSSAPVIETTCDIEEIWDEDILKQLLEQAKTYEERRRIRSRLRELMADCADRKQQGSSTSTTETRQSTDRDGAVVTTTTKVTTRTVSGGPASKNVSPFAKFKQLDRQNSQQAQKSPTTPSTPGSGSTAGNAPIFKFTDPALNARAATVKDQLLQWCQSKTKEYENVQITNFSASWVDGLAFCALIHHFLPDAFDYSQLTPQNRRKNFELAFTVADEKAGIAPLLDVEDMVVMKRPDWKCVFVYVQSIYRRFRNCQ